MSEPAQPSSPPVTPPPARKRLGLLRGLAATLGVIVMVLTGGCALVLLSIGGTNFTASDVGPLLGYIGLPFIIGAAIFWTAIKIGRE